MEKILDILQGIGFNWQVALANFFNFLIVFYILNKFIFRKIGKAIRERREIIAKGLEDAEKAKTELFMAEENRNKLLLEARSSANEIIAVAQEKGKGIIHDAEKKAEQRSGEIVASASEEIKRRETEMERELGKRTAHLVVDGIEKILKEEIDPSKNEAFISRLLKS